MEQREIKVVLCIVWFALGILACFKNSDSKVRSDGVGCIFMGLMSVVYGPFMVFIIWAGRGNWKPTRILDFEGNQHNG